MALTFHPEPGTILMCDYSGGFKKPEMLKLRPAIVVSPRLSHRDQLCTVVPLSGTEPDRIQLYHYKLEFERPLPAPWDSEYYWVKADMLCTVAFHRLHLIRTGRDQDGKRKYLNTQIKSDDLVNIHRCILYALGLPNLTKHI